MYLVVVVGQHLGASHPGLVGMPRFSLTVTQLR